MLKCDTGLHPSLAYLHGRHLDTSDFILWPSQLKSAGSHGKNKLLSVDSQSLSFSLLVISGRFPPPINMGIMLINLFMVMSINNQFLL